MPLRFPGVIKCVLSQQLRERVARGFQRSKIIHAAHQTVRNREQFVERSIP
jgi:hypothetical protein